MSEPIAVVSISGGTDSNATALVAIERYGRDRVRLVHADTGHEHPITEVYIRDYLPIALGLPIEIVRADFSKDFARKRLYIETHWAAKGVPQERVDQALRCLHPTGVPFLDLCMWKGRFPSTKAAFCTEELKRAPLDDFMCSVRKSSGLAIESWQGVRRNESLRRRNALEWERSDWGWMIHRPLVEWTAAMTFEIMARHGVDPNPLYSQGMKRVGCMPCINCGKDELHAIATRWPDQIDRVREWERIVGEVSKSGLGTLFFLEATGLSNAEQVEANNIDAAVSWAKTSRGGKQFDLERFMPASECSSVYGLCE